MVSTNKKFNKLSEFFSGPKKFDSNISLSWFYRGIRYNRDILRVLVVALLVVGWLPDLLGAEPFLLEEPERGEGCCLFFGVLGLLDVPESTTSKRFTKTLTCSRETSKRNKN